MCLSQQVYFICLHHPLRPTDNLRDHGHSYGLSQYNVGIREGCEVMRSACASVCLSVRSHISTRAQQLLRWATVLPQDMGRKLGGGLCAPFRGGAGPPSNTMSPEPRPTSVPSGILIHPTIWPQCTNVTDRQDNGPVA